MANAARLSSTFAAAWIIAACAPTHPCESLDLCDAVDAALAGAVTEPIAFTSADADDTLRVVVAIPRGATEKDAGTALMTVYDADGHAALSEDVPLRALGWDYPSTDWTAAVARERLGVTVMTFAAMEPDVVPVDDAGVGAFWPVADAETVARARAADGPLLCYVVAPGGYRCAWYDAEAGRGVALLEGAS